MPAFGVGAKHELEIRLIDNEMCLLVPLRLIARLAQARTPRASARPRQHEAHSGPRAAGAAVIAETIAVHAELDPEGQGARPVTILAEIDKRGFSFHPERQPPERLALFSSVLWRERRRDGGRLRLVDRARYALRAGPSPATGEARAPFAPLH